MKRPKLTLITISVAATFISSQAFSFELLTTDIAKFYQKTYENVARMSEAAKLLIQDKANLEAIGTFAQMGVDNVNNGFANVIARLDKGEEERQNLEQLERSQPAADACDTLTITAGLNESSCAADDQGQQLTSARSARQSLATAGGFTGTGPVPSVQDINAENTRIAKAIVTECQGLDGDCEKPSLVFSPPSGTLSAKEYRAAQIQADIAVNPLIKVPHAVDLNRETPEFKRALVADVRRENLREGIRHAKENILISMNGTLVDGVRKPGQVELYQQYIDQRMGSTDWICEVTNACPAGHVYAPPAELEKRMIQLDAVMLDLKLKMYESSLRTETYLLGMQQLQVDPGL